MNYKKLTGAGMAAVGFILFAVLVWPVFAGLDSIRQAVNSKQIALNQRKEAIVKILTLKKLVNAKRGSIEQLAVILPEDKKTEEIVVNIEEAARQSGINLRELKTGKVLSQDKSSPIQILQVELNGAGFYKPVLELLKALEKNLRLFDVQDFTLSLDSAGEAAGLLNLNIKFYTYYLNSPAATK